MRNLYCLLLFILLLQTRILAQSTLAIENELFMHLENITKYGSYGGSFDEKRVNSENRLLKMKLVRYGRRAVVLRYAFPKLKEQIQITTSKDGRFRIYSWDKEIGGTMHDYDSVFQYQGKSGKVYTWTNPETDDEDIGGFYHQIFQVNLRQCPIYLVVSTFIGSTSMHGQTIRSVRINGEKFDLEAKLIRTGSGMKNSVSFAYDFFRVVNRPERPIRLFEFDEAKREFRFPIVIEDEEVPQGRVTDKYITYRFNGRYFVKLN